MKLAERIFKRNDYIITSPFGTRKDPITGEEGTYHDGVDYGTNLEKWPQYGIESGKVLSCGLDANYKNAKYVWVEYPRLNIKLLYYHLDSIKVSKGQIVDENTVIGTTGKTGYATGIHLHLGMKYLNSSSYVNAEKFDYIPLNPIETAKRDNNKHQVEIIYEKVNARDGANGQKLGVYVPMGIYDVLDSKEIDGMTWVEINDGIWCALVDDCYIEHFGSHETSVDYKEKYEAAKAELELLRSTIDNVKKDIETVLSKL